MAYRLNGGDSIDQLKSKVFRLEKENEKLREGIISRRKALLFKWGIAGIVASIIPVVLVVFVKGYLSGQEATKAHNKKYEHNLFVGADKWVNDFNDGKGEAFCYVESAIKRGNGKIEDRMANCEVRQRNIKDTIRLDCSPSSATCYLAKVQCKAVR